jgi:hypothetical protein
MLKRLFVVLATVGALVGASANSVSASAKQGDYFGTVYGQIPGEVPGALEQTFLERIGLYVGKTSLNVKIFVEYGCDYPLASQGGYGTDPEMLFLNVPLSPTGSFTERGTFRTSGPVQTAGGLGGVGTISGQITGVHASGTFSRTAHVQGIGRCHVVVNMPWKATYDANGGPFFA